MTKVLRARAAFEHIRSRLAIITTSATRERYRRRRGAPRVYTRSVSFSVSFNAPYHERNRTEWPEGSGRANERRRRSSIQCKLNSAAGEISKLEPLLPATPFTPGRNSIFHVGLTSMERCFLAIIDKGTRRCMLVRGGIKLSACTTSSWRVPALRSRTSERRALETRASVLFEKLVSALRHPWELRVVRELSYRVTRNVD